MSIMAQEVSFTFYGDDNTGIGPPEPKPITRRRRWEIYLKARWHWLFGWRIINKTDHWHKREDCDGW